MDNWEALVSSRLGSVRLCAEAEREVVRELASHFSEIYDDARARGASEGSARDQALDSVRDWRRLARDVRREKETLMTMTPFRRRVILPGLVAVLLSAIALTITSVLHRMGNQQVFHPIPMNYGLYAVFNLPWLISLPVAGAAGAWLSRRAGGSAWQRLTAAMFPGLIYLAVIAFAMVIGLAVQLVLMLLGRYQGDHASATVWAARLTSMFLPWIVAPALSSLIGALPFLWLRTPEPAAPSAAVHA